MLAAITILVFLTTLCLLLGIYAGVRGRRATIENRLQRVVIDPIRREEGGEAVFVSNADRKRRGRREAKGLKQYVVRLEERLIQAGLLLRPQEFILIVLGLMTLGALVAFLLTGAVVSAISVVAIGLVLPIVFLNLRVETRRRTLNAQVGDMILLMANGLKAGHSLVQVMEGVSREISPPLSEHLKSFLRDTIMGTPMEDALVKLEQRANDDDLSMVITAILIQHQVGGNLSEILENISLTIRERVRLKSEIRALTAQGRLSAIVISLLPVAVALFIIVTNPEFLSILFEEALGWTMVVMAMVFQLIGILFIRRIVDIKV
ncbi:MAG: secretion system protein [Desulforudis sp.]|nr:MAG: secretion system protein [Desulforudis sp.]